MKTLKVAGCIVSLSLSLTLMAQENAWKDVDAAMGRTGQMQAGGVYKYSMSRRDLKVTKEGITIAPGLALGSWVAFQKMEDQAMLMGDLVLTEDEVEPVMLSLQEHGIEQTSIHNHLLGETPHIVYMHIEGHGNPVTLGKSVASALALTKTPMPAASTPPAAPSPLSIDQPGVEKALDYTGKVNGGILQFSVPRSEKIVEGGMEIPPAMGTGTTINFQPTGQGKAAISGDFVLLATEVNPVLRALRHNGIEVTAMHNHMLGDEPHLYFMHFWANNDAVKLAHGLQAALDLTNSQKPK